MQMLKVIIGCTELSSWQISIFFHHSLIVEKLWNSIGIVESSDCATITNNYNRPLFTFNCHSNVAYGAAHFCSIHSRRRKLVAKAKQWNLHKSLFSDRHRLALIGSVFGFTFVRRFVMQICDPICRATIFSSCSAFDRNFYVTFA